MFGDRCLGRVSCAHFTNWTCECTCDEVDDEDIAPTPVSQPAPSPAPDLRSVIEGLQRYAQHDVGCDANDLDPMDHTGCTCSLRAFHNPWGKTDP